jgi:hypothetical protein
MRFLEEADIAKTRREMIIGISQFDVSHNASEIQ